MNIKCVRKSIHSHWEKYPHLCLNGNNMNDNEQHQPKEKKKLNLSEKEKTRCMESIAKINNYLSNKI